MGYYTEFRLRVYGRPSDASNPDLIAAIETLYHGTNPFSGDTYKWYQFEDDIKGLSIQFPTLVFEVTGFGEDYPDIWRKFFHNGVVSGGKAKIVFPDNPFPGGVLIKKSPHWFGDKDAD